MVSVIHGKFKRQDWYSNPIPPMTLKLWSFCVVPWDAAKDPLSEGTWKFWESISEATSVGVFSVPQATSQITTQRLPINYKCSADHLVLLLTSSYNLN